MIAMNNINGKKQEESYKDVVISKYIEAFLKKDYCFFDNKTRGRNLMWCNFAKERDRIIATEELEKIEPQDKKDLFFYLERTEELYIADYEEICKFVSSLEPWEEIDAVIFDKTLEWTIAVTHEDISILVGVEKSNRKSCKNSC